MPHASKVPAGTQEPPPEAAAPAGAHRGASRTRRRRGTSPDQLTLLALPVEPAPASTHDATSPAPAAAVAPAPDCVTTTPPTPGRASHAETQGALLDLDLDAPTPARATGGTAARVEGPTFRPSSQDDLAPSGTRARVEANLAAIEMLRTLREEDRPATAQEQRTLARFSSWGAVPMVFDESRPEWGLAREQLRSLLNEQAYAAARRTTINAHYTDPAYVREMWAALAALGFAGGRVLEPGCGSGTFIGMAPEDAVMYGVELDPTSAAIAAALYPQATIRAESFADTRLPDGTFDAAIGNVPFGDACLHDPVHNRGKHSLHTHFILKALALTAPGGIVMVLTSRYTLDAKRRTARQEISGLADLLGAVRLPSGAHRRAAGTEVVTDLLVLRRREPGSDPASTAWHEARPLQLDGVELHINGYFEAHPEHVIGELACGRREHGSPELDVIAPSGTSVAGALADVLREITDTAASSGQTFAARTPALTEPLATDLPDAPEGLWDGHLAAHPDGRFSRVEFGRYRPLRVPRAQRGELRALLGLRDSALTLLEAEASTVEDTPEIDRLRAAARDAYQRYVAKYGPINRYDLRPTGREDKSTGEPAMARISPPVMRILRQDPHAPLVMALESFDETTHASTPATLLSRRALVAREPVHSVEEPEAALAVCLEEHGEVRIEQIASLLDQTPQAARAALGELVYEDPEAQRLVPAAEYLSGNVRQKLQAASDAAEQRPELAVNVAALERVMPTDLGMDEVEPRLGAAWIDAATHQEFLREILDDPNLHVESPGAGIWGIEGNLYSVAATSEWGTERMPAPKLVRRLIEQRPIEVKDEIEPAPGVVRRVINAEETAAAIEKADALQERFAEWCWEEPERGNRLLAEYNRRFNSIVLRDYTVEGERLTLPGLAEWFTPLPHQRAAVARMLSEPAVGLFHVVGAGKTAALVMGCTELKRLGMVSKPAVVVPNHMLEQFTREWLQLYPQTRLLAASVNDLAKDRRREFIARIATNDWDAVLLTRSAFERLPVHPETAAAYLASERNELRRVLAAAQDGRGLTVKRVEKALLRAEQAIKARLKARVDPGLTFEATGIDYLGDDEAHEHKNLRTFSNIPDAAIEGSNRATDLHLKIEHLRASHGRRVVTFMTATPIANSITEAHVMQRYLRPDLLEAAGILAFDAWAATFGRTVTQIEMAPNCGGQYRLKTRFARFQNVPEMLQLWNVCADVRTAEDLQLPTPLLRTRPDGKRLPETVVIPASPEVRDYIKDLGRRAQDIRDRLVPPEEDNMLKVSTDGRKAALDMRLVDGEPSSTQSKLEVVADRITRIWEQNRENVYDDPVTGEQSAVRGALQLVFCDLGTPSGEGWTAYGELRRLLVARGMPRELVRFVHEARTDVAKGRLFAAARAGHVAVLLGSTAKLGVGTNVQARCVALHHVDCPWRPADVEQREGRIMRQGNQNDEVGIYRYVVEGSFDGYMWQTIERKARFIAQVTRGKLDVREIDDIGDSALSFAEVKALASGDPLILEKATADAERVRLERLERAYHRNQQGLIFRRRQARARVERCERHAEALRNALQRRRDTRGEAFEMTIAGERVRKRAHAAHLVDEWVRSRARGESSARQDDTDLGELGELGGMTVDGVVRTPFMSRERHASFALRGLPVEPAEVALKQLDGLGASIVRQLEKRIRDLPAIAQEVEQERLGAAREVSRADAGIGEPFKHADALAGATQRCAEIESKMRQEGARQEAAAPSSAATAAGRLRAVTSEPDQVDAHEDVTAAAPPQAA